MEYSVVIVGLGAIGMGYDLDLTNVIYTHAKAFRAHSDFYLVAGIDCNSENRRIFEEIKEVVQVAKDSGCQDLVLLHCISSYPAPIEQSNLRTIPDLAEKFNVLSGLSDHTMGTTVATTSVALGACIIEKHFTLSRKDKGPDSEFSLEPNELKKLCEDTKIAWQSLGKAGYERKSSEGNNAKYRRSIYAIKDIAKGERLTEENVKRIRPGFGLMPKYWKKVLLSKANCNIALGTPISSKFIKSL